MFKFLEIIETVLKEAKRNFKGTDEEFIAKLRSKSETFTQDMSEILSQSLHQYYQKTRITEIQKAFSSFQTKHEELYQGGLGLFLMFVDINVTINTDMTNHFKLENMPDDERLKFDQLLHLHIKGCQVANEIYSLLKAGYADAALSRWRTLHETCVVFICLFENDTKVSRMFYDYQVIEKYKRALSFQLHHKTLKWEAIEDKEMKILEQEKLKLETKYGKAFLKEYGWAITILPKDKQHFTELEKFVGMDYMRPLYKWSNSGVHAGSDGLFNRLSFTDDIRHIPRNILAGPTHYGMVDPMQFTTSTLIEMTQRLLSLVDNFENELLVEILKSLHGEITEAMVKTKNKLH